MGSPTTGGSRQDFQGEQPRPLHIVKRSWSKLGGRRQQGPRRSSADTDESLGSAPDPPGGDRPLTIPKRRGKRGSQIFATS